ncbi:MAG: hypothetical protein ACKO2G_11775 [Verrucomicrobiales bacterium]
MKKRKHLSDPCPAKPCKNGFALIATLSITALITLLVLGLLSLSTQTARTHAQWKSTAMAQANARLSLMLAMGELQRLAGDDRRVTAPADLKMAAGITHSSRYWTGVYSNAAGNNASTEIYTRTPQSRFEGWLVSGAKQSLTNPDSTTVPLTNAIQLVGPGSAGDSTAQYVTAPTLDVRAATGGQTSRISWWVGDEGTKARGNLPSGDPPGLAATELTLGKRGAGWETVAGLETFPEIGGANEPFLRRALSVPNLALAVPGTEASLRRYFHALTNDSRTLLTNTLTGGLRMDLTPYVENGFPSTPANSLLPNPPVAGRNIIPATVAPNIKGPIWSQLRALRSLRPTSGDTLTVSLGNGADQPLVAPLLLDVRVLMGAKLAMVPGSTTEYRIHPCGKIAVSLANPYPYRLRWRQNLDVEVFLVGSAGRPSCIWEAAGQPRYLPQSAGDASVFGNAVFTIPAGELPPGEAQSYTVSGRVLRAAASSLNPVTVPLGPFLAQGPSDFRKCVELEHTAVNTGSKSLDVREAQTSSVLGIEMRLGGSSRGSGILRRVNALELDNAFFSQVRRGVNADIASRMTDPFPLHLYAFQISQPGADYGSLLPNASQLGVRNSTLRTFADFNLRAAYFPRPIAGYLTPPYFMESSDTLASLPFTEPGGDTGTAFTRNLALSPLAWGHSPVSGPRKTILFDVPNHLVSLAQFQHADLTANDGVLSVAVQPGNALGNSYAHPLVKRGLNSEVRYDYTVLSTRAAAASAFRYYDISYLLNASLWDSYFLSTVPTTGITTPLNSRIVDLKGGSSPDRLRDPLRSASQLAAEGGLNVNSTSKEAWKAFLASNRKLRHPADITAAEGMMFPRHLSLQGSRALLPKPSGNADDSLNGFRRINDQQLDALAEEITRQVRLRGPFLSLAHFVNRSLVDLTSDTNNLGRSGALQSAIDNSGLNMAPGRTDSGFANLTPANNLVQMQARPDGTPEADMVGGRATPPGPNNDPADSGPPVWASASRDLNPGNTGSMLADREMLTNPTYRPEQGFRSTGIPGWLTQADILQVIGPAISARSDTFRLRASSETLDANGRVVARSWCEAIVQRVPEFLDSTNLPETPTIILRNGSLIQNPDITPVNRRYGRRFEVISFRWLHPDEI